MASFIRRNAWENGGTFDNPDLLWYAKGVGAMQAMALNDPNSWWFFAAIHGEYLTGESSFPGWAYIPAPPQVPTTPLPSQELQEMYWDQCQHQTWFFAPWHRGYLIALEAQIREAVVSLGGPSDWALPYWNYFGPEDEYKIPPAFTQQTMPDGKTPNPLYVLARYGPQNDGDIYIPIPPVSEQCMTNTVYTGSNASTPRPGFGGPQTGFSHSGNISGNLENNPHNLVHVDVGGNAPTGPTYGLMSDPGIAALDPIFYLHHSNIDRMWAAWNESGNSNPTDANWLNGPASVGERPFVVPMPGATPWTYTPADVDSLSKVDYTYDDLTPTTTPQAPNTLSQRLVKLGVAPEVANTAQGERMDSSGDVELLGANNGPLRIGSSGAHAHVMLDSGVQGRVSASLAAASGTNVPDHVYLQLENIRGNRDAFILDVSVNQQPVGSVAMFGLRRASMRDGEHGGGGLTHILDITDVIDNLFINKALDVDALDVRITPNNAVPEGEEITIGRISIYREGHQ